MAAKPAHDSNEGRGWRWWVQHVGSPLAIGVILLAAGKLWDDARSTGDAECEPGNLARVQGVTATAESTLPPEGDVEYSAARLTDNDPNTMWVEGDEDGYGEGQRLQFVLPAGTDLQMICVVNGYSRTAEQWARNARVQQFVVETEQGSTVSHLPDKSAEEFASYQRLEFRTGRTSYVTLTLETARAGSGPSAAKDTSVSEVQFWARR